MHFLGIHGMPRRIYTYEAGLGFETWNMVASIGSFVLGFSMLIFLFNAIKSWKGGEVAGNDPWDAATLELALPSPPPEYNFAQLPVVSSSRPLWDSKFGSEGHGTHVDLSVAGRKVGHVDITAHVNQMQDEPIHMPNPSYWPIVTAAGPVIAAFGMVTDRRLSLVGIAILVFGVYRWAFEPAE
jgi:cytochrome c oxidase subunit 1